jgi:hypothetical protein
MDSQFFLRLIPPDPDGVLREGVREKNTRSSSRMLHEFIITQTEALTGERFGNMSYKGIPLAQLIGDKVYWRILADPEIGDMFRREPLKLDLPHINLIIRRNIDRLSSNPVKYPLRVARDLVSWLRSVFASGETKKTDVLIPINQKKYFSYTSKVEEKLRERGQTVRYYAYDRCRREVDVSDRERFVSERRDFPAFWKPAYYRANSICRAIDKILGTWRHHSPEKALIIEGDTAILHITGLVSRLTGCRTRCLQWGSIGTPVPKTGWRHMPFDRFLAWGEFFRESIEEYNPGMDVRIVGHPGLQEPDQPDSSGPDAGARSAEDRADRPVVLFAVQKVMRPFIDEEDLERFLDAAVDTARRLPDHTIRIRSHPNYPIPDHVKQRHAALTNIEWHDYFQATLDESLRDALVCVTISSTLSLEAMNYNAVPLFLRTNNIELYLHRSGYEFRQVTRQKLPHVADPGNVAAAIRRISSRKPRPFRTRLLFEAVGSQAVENILKEFS